MGQSGGADELTKVRDSRRRFNARQRLALRLASAGRCQICGARLTAEWHADHQIAWSKGGATDVRNGQATCPQCNHEKGIAA